MSDHKSWSSLSVWNEKHVTGVHLCSTPFIILCLSVPSNFLYYTMSSSDSTSFSARSNDAIETLQPSHVSSALQYAPSDDDSDIIFIDSSDFPLTSSVEPNEGNYISRTEMVTQIRGLERVRLYCPYTRLTLTRALFRNF